MILSILTVETWPLGLVSLALPMTFMNSCLSLWSAIVTMNLVREFVPAIFSTKQCYTHGLLVLSWYLRRQKFRIFQYGKQIQPTGMSSQLYDSKTNPTTFKCPTSTRMQASFKEQCQLTENEARRKKWFANPGGEKQIPYVSYEGYRQLSASLAAVVYFS